MVVATPLKSVMTLEPFIGGACFVEISGRHDSGVLLIEYDEQAKRLKLPERSRGETPQVSEETMPTAAVETVAPVVRPKRRSTPAKPAKAAKASKSTKTSIKR
jgi:hypothetical protein